MSRPFTMRDGLAAAQLPVFSVFLGFGILFGLQGKNGWFSISLFAAIRIGGASCMLATLITDARGVWAAVFVCESLGLVLLTFVLLNLLKRANTSLNVLTDWHFRIPELICWAGIGVSVADFVGASERENAMAPSTLTRVSVGLFVALFVWSVLLFYYISRKWKQLPVTERRCVVCVGAAIPFMTVRMLQTLIYTATAEDRFSAVTGSSIIYLFMTMLPEVAVLTSIVWAIRGLQPLSSKTKGSVRVPGDDREELDDLQIGARRDSNTRRGSWARRARG